MQTKKQQSNVVNCGDCLLELSKLDCKSVDLILIDPPYNIGKDEWDDLESSRRGINPNLTLGNLIMTGWKKFLFS